MRLNPGGVSLQFRACLSGRGDRMEVCRDLH